MNRKHNESGGARLIRATAILLLFALILPAAACSTIKTGKTMAIDNPLQESRNKKSLNQARQDVEKSRRALDKCMESSGGGLPRLQGQKTNYPKDAEAYASLPGSQHASRVLRSTRPRVLYGAPSVIT